jgi:hypothetical protein
MFFKLSFFILTFSSMALAQIHPSPGGGDPGREEAEEVVCHSLSDTASSMEKTFVESYRLKYSSEDDFSSLLQKIQIGINLRALNNPKLIGKMTLECNDRNIEALTKILKFYNGSYRYGLKCDSFAKRYTQVPYIEKIIESYGKN